MKVVQGRVSAAPEIGPVPRGGGGGGDGVINGHPNWGVMDATKPYRFIGFGAMDVTKPYEFIGFGAMEVTKPNEFIREGCFHNWA